MSWNKNTSLDDLQKAVKNYDKQRATEICDGLINYLSDTDDRFPESDAKEVMKMLRDNRYFDLMLSVGDAFLQAEQRSPQIQRQYAQALLDKNMISAGVFVLQALIEKKELTNEEQSEAVGLLGRAGKQSYINATDKNRKRNIDYLKSAIKYYHDVYESDHTFNWHGINAVALLYRAERDEIEIDGYPHPSQIAKEVLKAIAEKELLGHATMWDYATAAEASLALGRTKEAVKWLAEYVDHKKVNAFEISSTLRQFTEVWEIDESKKPEGKLVSILKAALLKQDGGSIRVALDQGGLSDLMNEHVEEGFEKVFGKDGTIPMQWFFTGIERAQNVARIESKSSGKKIGTGFLMQGKDLDPALGDELFLLTNDHVISERGGAVKPQQARANFEMRKIVLDIKEIVWSSSKKELDFSLCRLEGEITGAASYPIDDSVLSRDGKQRVYIIGHPSGRDLSFSINDNKVLDFEAPMFHYRAPTEPGSSGSPVFDDEWNLVGLHHRGLDKMPRLNDQEGYYEANEGIWIRSIREAIEVAKKQGS